MSSLSPQINSFSNPFDISSDNLKFELDLNQTLPNIMNSSNDFIVNEQGATYISNNALYCPSIEKKVGGEPLKQYFSALATDGTNVLPIPDKKIIYGIYNVAYREKNCLSTPEPKESHISEVSGISTPQSTPFIKPVLSGEYYNHPQGLNVKAFPPSPVSPKINTLGNNSPYSYFDSNVTLTPGSRNEVATPVSSLTYNSSIVSNNSTVDDDSFTQCNYESNSKNIIYNNNPQMNTQTFFTNINNQGSISANQQQQQFTTLTTPTTEIQQNLYYVNVNGNWELQNQGNTCFYARRKEELKNINSPIPLKTSKIYVPVSEIPNNALYSNANVNTYQYPSNCQTQQVIVQSNSSVQQIVVQQPTQNIVESVIVNDTNTSGMIPQQQQPTQQIIVQTQVPTITVSPMSFNSPAVNNVPLPIQVQQTQTQTQLPPQDNTVQQVIVQLQPVENTPNSTVTQQPQSVASPYPSSLLFSNPPRMTSPVKQEITSPLIKMESNQSENSQITPVSSPVMEEREEKRSSVIINLSNYKPISSHLDNYKNNRPAVLKYIPATKQKNLKKRMESASRITKDSSSYFKCEFCQKEFLKYYQLKSHLKTHTSDKPYKCEYCTRAFCRKHDLRRHVRIHTGDTPYICSNCFKGFARSDACTRHVRQNLCKSNIINYNPVTNKVEVVV